MLSMPKTSRVLQTGIGSPDTGLNDAVYDPDTDVAVHFDARRVRLQRRDDGEVHASLSGRETIGVRFKQNHLRSSNRGGVSAKSPSARCTLVSVG